MNIMIFLSKGLLPAGDERYLKLKDDTRIVKRMDYFPFRFSNDLLLKFAIKIRGSIKQITPAKMVIASRNQSTKEALRRPLNIQYAVRVSGVCMHSIKSMYKKPQQGYASGLALSLICLLAASLSF